MHKKLSVLMMLALCLTTSIVAAGEAVTPHGIDTPRCKETIARIVAETGSSFDSASPSGDNIFLKHPMAHEMSLTCSVYMPFFISVNWNSAFPPNLYFDLIAASGTVITHETRNTIKEAAMRCHRAAIKDKREMSEVNIKSARLECQAFLRDGGGTTITVSPND